MFALKMSAVNLAPHRFTYDLADTRKGWTRARAGTRRFMKRQVNKCLRVFGRNEIEAELQAQARAAFEAEQERLDEEYAQWELDHYGYDRFFECCYDDDFDSSAPNRVNGYMAAMRKNRIYEGLDEIGKAKAELKMAHLPNVRLITAA